MEDESDINSCYSFRIVGGQSIDVTAWPTPDEGALNPESREKFLNRKRAILLYLQGSSTKFIKETTGISAKYAYKLIKERCLEIHADGRPYGWRGLIAYQHINPYKRRTKIHIDQFGNGGAGAFQTLLDNHPELRSEFEKRIKKISSGKRLEEIKIKLTGHSIWFLNQLRRLGYEQRNEWPFNTNSGAYFSVRRYISKVLSENPKAIAAQAGGPDLVRKLKTGDGSNRPVTRFLQRVEMDAHKIDGRFCVSMPLIGGGYKEQIVHRLWVVVIIDVVSRVILGYYLSLAKEVSADDVLRTIKRSLKKWTQKEIIFSDIAYRKGAGMLSSQGNQYVGLCWDETSVDGALSEACKRVESVLLDTVGSILLTPENSFSKRRAKDDRPFIEVFFKHIAGRGFQRLSNTTGAKASERRERNPEAVAIESRFQYEYAEEILDVIVANYNATPHSGINNRTPLEYAQFLYESAQQSIRIADPKLVDALMSVRKLCVVRGGALKGRAPYVEFYGARYSNDVLNNRQNLVGCRIWVVNHKEDDARIALASTEDGTSLGVLRAAPPWHSSPHSLALRKGIKRLASLRKPRLLIDGDAITSFIDFVEQQPDKKLPVYPLYLEARRILSLAADQFIGESLLNVAKKKINGDLTSSNRKTEGINSLTSEDRISANKNNISKNHLPQRRIAAIKS